MNSNTFSSDNPNIADNASRKKIEANYIIIGGNPMSVSFKIHHGGCFTPIPSRSYVGGQVSYIDVVDIDEFCLHGLKEMIVKLGYGVVYLMYYHFLKPRFGLDYGLYPLSVNADVLELANPTIKILVDCEMLYETEGVGPMRNFKEVEDLDYDPKHDELYDDDEHILKDVLVSINNFNFNPKSKHDLNIATVEVPEHDPDVIDYDSFGSDLDDEIDSDKELNLQN
ncbi:hypothetical protein Tco_0015570 [Tanacetum coccineum]